MKRRIVRGVLLGTVLAAGAGCKAQQIEPMGWWPDASTGLMWSGHAVGYGPVLNYAAAAKACQELVSADGRHGWRLPTIAELDGWALVPGLKDRIPGLWLWSTTPTPSGGFVSERIGSFSGEADSKPSDHLDHDAVCVRQMEPDVAAAAAEAKVTWPVPSVDVLRTVGPLRQAYVAFTSGDYPACVSHAHDALQRTPQLGDGYLGLGLCEAALAQWDQAVADLASAAQYGALHNDVSGTLKSVKGDQTKARKGKAINMKKVRKLEWNYRYVPSLP